MPDHVEDALQSILAGTRPSGLESSTLDFKTVGRSVKDTLRDLAEAAVCFANAHGGHLVVGVRDDVAGQPAFVGANLDPLATVGRIYELTDPSLIVIVDVLSFAGVDLTVITVPRSPDVHQVGGRATERVGTSCQPMSASRIAAALADRRGDDWSSKDSGIPVESTNAVAEAHVRDLLRQLSDPERASWARLPWADVCRRLGVVDGPHFTNGGALLFTDLGRPHAQYTRRAPNTGLIAANDMIDGPGVSALRRLLELIESRAERTALLTPHGQQLLIGDLPDAAVREAVVNAFMHRDYRSHEIVRIEHDASRLRVTSPGGFVPGVTVDNVLTVSSRCRNLSLANAVRALGLAESAGVGVDRMYASMTAAGHRPPQFTADTNAVEATLHGGAPNEPFARFVADLPESRKGDPDTLLVLSYLLEHRTATAQRLAPVVQRSVIETETVLLGLSAPGQALIERTADTAHSSAGEYRLTGETLRALGAAVRYRARSGHDSDRKVISIVREVGAINGRMVQTMFDVQPATASRILSDLVDRRILRKTSKATRGPSVTYGPGDNFPARRPKTTDPEEAQQPTLELGD